MQPLVQETPADYSSAGNRKWKNAERKNRTPRIAKDQNELRDLIPSLNVAMNSMKNKNL